MHDAVFRKNLCRLPKARVDKLVVKDFDDDILVYDLENHQAHHLNKSLSIVWRCCDGETTTGQVAKLLSETLNTRIEEDFVRVGLDELRKANLLDDQDNSPGFASLSRREVLFRYSLPTVLLPLVMTLIAPKSIHAQSCVTTFADCTPTGIPCCDASVTCSPCISISMTCQP